MKIIATDIWDSTPKNSAARSDAGYMFSLLCIGMAWTKKVAVVIFSTPLQNRFRSGSVFMFYILLIHTKSDNMLTAKNRDSVVKIEYVLLIIF